MMCDDDVWCALHVARCMMCVCVCVRIPRMFDIHRVSFVAARRVDPIMDTKANKEDECPQTLEVLWTPMPEHCRIEYLR